MTLPEDDARAVELRVGVRGDDVGLIRRLLSDSPDLAKARFGGRRGGTRTALHFVTDWPGRAFTPGHREDTYKPENFGLMGPLICQDDLTMYWNSESFWEGYFQEMEKRNKRSISNRLGNIYRNYCYKFACSASGSFSL